MFCSNCGAKIEDNASFCPNCGNSTNAQNKGFVSNLDATVQKVESQLGDATADIAAHASNSFNNLERDLNGAVKRVIKSNNLLFIGVKILVHLVQEGCLLVLLDLSLIEDWDINRNISVRDGE